MRSKNSRRGQSVALEEHFRTQTGRGAVELQPQPHASREIQSVVPRLPGAGERVGPRRVQYELRDGDGERRRRGHIVGGVGVPVRERPTRLDDQVVVARQQPRDRQRLVHRVRAVGDKPP